VRKALDHDAEAVAEVTNRAYEVEKFFVDGDRTSAGEVRELTRDGCFLVEDAAGGGLAGSVYVRWQDGRGYFGLLAVDPAHQGEGLGRRLVDAAEALCRAEGCAVMDLRVVNLRSELPPWYRKLGYQECGTEPFTGGVETKLPCHFIRMSKSLGAA
jgi:ribosomal protein S18 acetylase RimI-like enzyme